MSSTYLGVEIGGTKLQVVLGDAHADITERRRMTVDPGKGAAGIRKQIEAAVAEFSGKTITAAGLGFGGPINIDTGQVALSNQVGGWEDFNIRTWLTEIAGAPAVVENDSNSAALAEARNGAGAGYSLVFYTNMGSGMGGGYVVNGDLYHGARPAESELGLIPFSKSGDNIESHCSGWAVDRKLRMYISQHPYSELAKLVGEERRGEARFLVPAIRNGDVGAEAIFNELADDLAFALAIPAHLFHPDVVVMGGGLSLIGEPLREAVAARLPDFMAAGLKPGPDVKLAALGEDAVCVGALLLAQAAAE